MKKFTKLLGIVLIVALVMSMGAGALAEEGNTPAAGGTDTPAAGGTDTPAAAATPDISDTNGTFEYTTALAETATSSLTVTNIGETKHTFELYQIFVGDVSKNEDGNPVLANIVWGSSVTAAGKTALGDAADLAELITTAELAKAFADTLVTGENNTSYLQNPNAKTVDAGADAVWTGLHPGYYLVKDVDNSQNIENGAYTAYVMQVIGTVTRNAKLDAPSSEKKVQDINDSTETKLSDLKDSADYDIGDKIPYTLTFTLPANYGSYEAYKVEFFDDMSKGLTYNSDAEIFYGASDTTGTTITFAEDSGENAKTSAYAGGKVYKATIEDLKTTAPDLKAGDVVKITYTVTLNDDAVIGAEGNPNKYHVEYDNNPNKEGEGTGKTPEDVNIVFTYDIEVDKVTGTGSDKKDLAGAAFALYKLYLTVPEGKTAATEIKYDNNRKTFAVGSDKWVLVKQMTASEDTATFTFTGVDDGTYLLVETTTPAGYNSIEPSKFKVTATHTDDDGNPALTLTSVSGENVSGNGLAPISLGTKTKSETDATITGVKTEVVNNSGTVLPSTGGIGTTIFYVVGSILVVAAGVLLITKKRMSREG